MTTDQPSQKQSGNTSSSTAWVVTAVGALLVAVLLCGLLLRGMTDRQPGILSESNQTSVQPDAPWVDDLDESGDDQHPGANISTQSSPQDAASMTPSDSGTSGTTANNAQATTDAPPADDEASSTETTSRTSLATLTPIEIEGIQSGPEGPWQSVSFSGKRYERALCMSPPAAKSTSQISFSLGGNFKQFGGIAGLQDAVNEDQTDQSDQPEAIFRIYGDENLLWDSVPQQVAGATESFQLDVRGLDFLTLVVEYGQRGDGARPAWAGLLLAPAASDATAPNDAAGQLRRP